jgi:hemoglobin
MTPENQTTTPYALIGGESAVRQLVKRFYQLMDELPEAYEVRKLHPENLAGSETMLFEYLSGWLGGPNLYIAKKGHPRLRMRHAPFAIGKIERDQWMLCMTQALHEQLEESKFRSLLIQQFSELASHMINSH